MLNFLYRKKVQTNLALLVGVLITGLLIFGTIAFYTTRLVMIKGPYYEEIITSNNLIADILPPPYYIIEAYLTTFQELGASNAGELNALIERNEKLRDEFNERHAYWQAHLSSGKLKDDLTLKSNKIVQQYFTVWQNSYIPALRTGNKELAKKILEGELTPLYKEHREIIDIITAEANKNYEELEKKVTEVYQRAQLVGIATWVITFILGVLIAIYISRIITKRLTDVVNHIVPVYMDISQRTDEQSQAITQQSAAVHETTTTMDELNASFKHTESLAIDSSTKANESMKVAEQGNELIKNMVENLHGHREKVAQIANQISQLSEITRQIHNIANVTSNLTNQTNILALNAAVQAVHTKQDGEGFSVIASEIRKLADDSKKFLSHIDILSENIQQAIAATNHLAEEGTSTIQEIILLAKNASSSFDRLTSITTSSYECAEQVSLNVKQQIVAVSQVVEAMENINEGSQQTYKGMQEVRIALTKLSEETNELKSIVA